MKIPDWAKPANWTPEARAAAREALRVAAIFAFTLFQASKTGQIIKDASLRKLAGR